MRINIAASHRFHLLDLARELEANGHEVRFYSYVPTARAISFGLKKECSFSLYYLMLPFLVLTKLFKNADWTVRLVYEVLDWYLGLFMKPCDIYIALGTVYEKSLIKAKNKFGAITILEWGSKHIEEQQRILSEMPGFKKQAHYFNQRSLNGYSIADYIAIPANHVKQSFIERGIQSGKLLQNPYGVDLSMFKPTQLVEGKVYDLIMVGGWSYRKGCDLLVQVCREYNYSLLHVGSIVDLPFPDDENMTHIDSVDQRFLINYYAQARVFVLPSREEGLALVQPQAIACGLPIVCSEHTGGRDLCSLLTDKKWILEMGQYSSVELANCIVSALALSRLQVGRRQYADGIFVNLKWEAYGLRYHNSLKKIFAENDF